MGEESERPSSEQCTDAHEITWAQTYLRDVPPFLFRKTVCARDDLVHTDGLPFDGFDPASDHIELS